MDAEDEDKRDTNGWPNADLDHALILWKTFMQNLSPGTLNEDPRSQQDSPKMPLRYPAVDIVGRLETLVVLMDIPGIRDPEHLQIHLTAEQIYVETFIGDATQTGDVIHRLERPVGTVSRRIALPEKVVPSSARSSYKHGLLTIEVNIDTRKEEEEGSVVDVDFE